MRAVLGKKLVFIRMVYLSIRQHIGAFRGKIAGKPGVSIDQFAI
jgi:hypothetical protein